MNNMAETIVIDKDLCIGCGLCVKDCPDHKISLADGKAIVKEKKCIECGHCYAICPKHAVDMLGYDKTGCDDFADMADFDSDRLLTAMKCRRTIRHFKDKPVEQEKIDKILEAGRCCQTATNAQSVHFTVLGSMQKAVERECVKMYKAGVKVGSTFVKGLQGKNVADDFFFKGAPLVIVVSGVGNMNRGLATSYMELMADSLGLGCLVSGFTEICINANPKIRSMIKLPITEMIYHVLVIGYPDVKFCRAAPRKPLKIRNL